MGGKRNTSGARFAQLLQPVLDAIIALGGSARPSEVKEWILKNLSLSTQYTNAVHSGGESKFGNDVDWARFYLVRAGYIDSSKRGVWSITEKGRTTKVDAKVAVQIVREVDRDVASETAEAEVDVPGDAPVSYKSTTLAILKKLPPKGFEQLCQRLLRESGFEEVTVTGRAGDGGIDGHGILKLNAFISFRALFQCKRYKDSVGADVVRDFRGAMVGRADKGMILTTGHFTTAAELEASRDGAQPIELVDGDSLVGLLGELELGLKPTTSYEVDEQFFRQFE